MSILVNLSGLVVFVLVLGIVPLAVFKGQPVQARSILLPAILEFFVLAFGLVSLAMVSEQASSQPVLVQAIFLLFLVAIAVIACVCVVELMPRESRKS